MVVVELMAVIALVVTWAPLLPRTIGLCLAAVSFWVLRLHPRKTLDMSWRDLCAALKSVLQPLGRKGRGQMEKEIAEHWAPKDEAVVFLSVRTGFDLFLKALELPQSSEVLFVPGINIPGMVEIVEQHGLRPVGVDPPSHEQMLPSKLAPFVTPETKLVVITHLFGTVHNANALIREAKELGLVVFEDCAQAFVGTAGSSLAATWPRGFRGHEGSDACFVSFGNIKTLTALGGAVGHVRKKSIRDCMRRLENKYPVRSQMQRLSNVLIAFIFKIFCRPCLYGLAEAMISAAGFSFDDLVIESFRGFKSVSEIRQKPTLATLETLLERLKTQSEATFDDPKLRSSVACRRRIAEIVIERITQGGIHVPTKGDGVNGWWLLPVLAENPRRLVAELIQRGFDATCTSTQLKSVSTMAKGGKPSALRPSEGKDFMDRVVYLPLTPEMSPSDAEALAAAILDIQRNQVSKAGKRGRQGTGVAIVALFLGLVLMLRPMWITSWLLSAGLTLRLLILGSILLVLLVLFARWLAADKDLKMDPQLLKCMSARPRPEGVAFCKQVGLQGLGRIDGAVLLTGATGFVGGGILFSMLARANELGVTRIVLLIRKRSGKTVEDRMEELRNSHHLAEVREAFDELVVGLEGDVAERDFGWKETNRGWPYQEPLKAVLHCAGDVRFQQPVQKAALSLVSATLQMQQLASQWDASRFLFVSTAFVHGVPSTSCLEEKLVELRDFDPMELYRDAVSHGSWAARAMRELGFPNTYTFTKAVAEHLVVRACDSESMDVRIVRPGIVGPAWAFPWIGWAGDKPSTIIGGGTLLARRGLRFFRDGTDHACPVVPVDFVADVCIGALAGARSSSQGRILHATLDRSEACNMPSFNKTITHLIQGLALTGQLPLPELGLMMKLMKLSDNETIFWLLNPLVNVLPIRILHFMSQAATTSLGLLGMQLPKGTVDGTRALVSCCTLAEQYHPFTSPAYAWHFTSALRVPSDFNFMEYVLIIVRAIHAFARPGTPRGPPKGYAEEFRNVKIVSPDTALTDAFLAFTQPKSSFFHSVVAFVVRLAFGWMKLTVTVDVASLDSVMQLQAPLVLCPTHRSLLDFVIIGATCLQFQPILPTLRMPQVAADAEFSGLPFLGWALAWLGAFFVRRGGGAVQPEPALRAQVGKVFHRGRPLEVFLEGMRSRGRRQLRLRTGLLKTLRDISQRTVALVPLALSYELLPEDEAFYRELSGLPREKLSTRDLLTWALRGLRGELPPLGEARLRLGRQHTLDSSSDLDQLVAGVQRELVELTSLTTIHARALAELLELPPTAVASAFEKSGVPIRESKLPTPKSQLLQASLWPLVLQAATLHPLRSKLPRQWARWLVEGVFDAKEEPEEAVSSQKVLDKDAFDVSALAAALTLHLEAAEAIAVKASEALREGGMVEVTEEHLVQELLANAAMNGQHLPGPLARGAASIVASKTKVSSASLGGKSSSSSKPRQPAAVGVLWPSASTDKAQLSSEEALDRWGYKDTRFVAQYFDGKPAAQITSKRYPGLAGQPMYKLWELFTRELSVPMNVRDVLPERPMPQLPKPEEGLEEVLTAALPTGRSCFDAESRLRAGTGHGLADIWRLRTRQLPRIPDAVVRPESEEEVQAVLSAATAFADGKGFAVVPVGGRTNVTSATACPPKEVDPRPFVALDMRGLSKIVWVNAEDGVAMIEAGITGMALKESLSKFGVTMGMEPDSMEFSTLGGWISTRASGMKRARYGNIEDMILEVRLVTPAGALWQRHSESSTAGQTAIGRASTGMSLPGLVLGSEGCLGVVTSAVVRVRPLPQVIEYQSVVFADWARGAMWMREVARLPAALRPASCRLMDPKQLALARALREESSSSTSKGLRSLLQDAFLRWRGVSIDSAAAATLVFEGTKPEVALQQRTLAGLVAKAGGVWGGASSGEAGYALTFAIAYLRDFGMDYRILSESLETMAPWSVIGAVWPAVQSAVEAEHRALRLPGRPFMSCRMTQLYDEGGVLYMYFAVCTAGLAPERALEAFSRIEHAARAAVMASGGCLSHHHGVGKLRASLLPQTQSPVLTKALQELKTTFDPANVLGARNGVWAVPQDEATHEQVEKEPNDAAVH